MAQYLGLWGRIMTKNTSNKSIPSRIEKVTKFLVTAYETGGIPLVLIVVGAAMAVEAEFDLLFDGSSGLLRRETFLIGIGLVLAGAVCWTFSVYMMQQRASEKLRLLEAIVEASKNREPVAFFASVADFLSEVGFRTTVTDTHVSKMPDIVEPPNGDGEKDESPPKDASRSKNVPDISEAT